MPNDASNKTAAAPPQIEKGTATFADNVLTLAGGTTIALAVSILASPITSRLFGPESFGLAAVFQSGAATLAAIACLRYEVAIVLPKKDEDAAQILAICGVVLLSITILTAVLTIFFGSRLLILLNAAQLEPILWLFPVTVFLMGSQFPLKLWFTRQKNFKTNAASSVLSSLPITVAAIIGGMAGYRSGENLVVFRSLGLIFAPLYLVRRVLKGEIHFILHSIKSEGMRRLAKKYIKLPMFDTGSILFGVLSSHVPVWLLTSFFSAAICGLYTKALYLLLLPALVIAQSVGQVFLQESAAAKAVRLNLAGLFEVVFNRMITIGTLPFAILALIGPELFQLFLGARWTESGVYAQILMPQIFLGFLIGSIDSLFVTLRKQELNLLSNALILMLRVVILIYGGLMLRDVRLTLFIYMVANVLVILWRISLLIRATKASATRPITHFFRCIAYAVPSVTPIVAAKYWFALEAVYLVVLTPIFTIPYIVLVLRHDHILRNLFSKYFQRALSFKR